ncbi:hypothetical protein N7532_008853 [Penicillium argentinense]|uniref:RED-like N-terminal domain-containing protein n=1 Tax=Penicillium argentinense TaxID=1131581 RepID=A0A9W9EY72_9EURO|nr:uncharacterized protein N7532_008853 [Penicillium argentinense]KAJ5090169.1 hypothetical protein N7532_008853 [Penicillium argentinense]
MNNEQFRRLLADNKTSSKSDDKPGTPSHNAPGGATPGPLLGSRMRSSIPMTPRSVTGVNFARQLAEQRRESEDRPTKRFKSSAAPKGSKLPEGYQDRAQLRNAQAEAEEKNNLEKRVKALEEMKKLGQIDQEAFDKLCSEIGVGGDTSSTHMVKGLDWKLLKRVKAGEDITKTEEQPAPVPTEDEPLSAEMAEEEFERLMEEKAQEEVTAAPKEQREKKGTMAPPPPPKMTRDEILKELRASRAAPPPPPESILGSGFKKLGEKKPEKKRFVEVAENGRRREVLIITDAQGNTKRKVRWIDKPGEKTPESELPGPLKDSKTLGMEVPAEIAAKIAAKAAAEEEEEDDNIFAGVGTDYNPLAGIEDDDDSSSDEEGETKEKKEKYTAEQDKKEGREAEQKRPDGEAQPARPRNYFGTSTSSTAAEPEDRSNPIAKDPAILAALKRAAALRQASPSAEDSGESGEAALRHKKFLEEARRRDAMDAADMDMEFGGSRIEDGDEEDDGPLLDFDDDGEGQQRGGAKKRKRGPKKKKGDKNSVSDVMNVLEGRKKD